MSETPRKPRVLLVGPTPPPMGGIVRYCEDVMGSPLLNERYELAFFPANIPFELRPQAFTKKSKNILKRDGVISSFRQIRWALKRAKELRRQCRRERYDIVHIPSCTGIGFWRNALHVTYAMREGCKVVWQLLGAIDDYWADGSSLRRHYIRKYLDRADVHLVQSTGLRDVTATFTAKPVVAIFNGVQTEALIAPDGFAHSDPADGKVRFLTVGTLGHRKGIFDTIKAAKTLMADWPQLQFVFVGGGEVDYFRQLVIDEGVGDHFIIAGPVDDAEKIHWLQTSDVFNLPSYSEGQPIAILEAMATGLPVISSTVGSIPEVVKEPNGRLVTAGDVEALAGCIRELAGSAELREQMGRQNATESEAKYSVKRTMQEIGDVYETLIAAGGNEKVG